MFTKKDKEIINEYFNFLEKLKLLKLDAIFALEKHEPLQAFGKQKEITHLLEDPNFLKCKKNFRKSMFQIKDRIIKIKKQKIFFDVVSYDFSKGILDAHEQILKFKKKYKI